MAKVKFKAVGNSTKHQSVSVERITNGFLARHSTSDDNGNYKDKTVYHPKRPKFSLVKAK